MKLSNKLAGSSRTSQQSTGILPLEFHQIWGQGPVFQWYNDISHNEASSKIDRLQIRITSGLPPHRFVVLYMQDQSIHRFDRRPIGGVIGDVITNTPVATKDECDRALDDEVIAKINKETECEMELFLNGKADLMIVLSACFAISKDQSAKEYTLFAHNCFFFSWTILMVTSRYCLPPDMLETEPLMERLQPHLPHLTSFIVDEIVELLVELVVITVSVFRDKASKVVFQGLELSGQLAAKLPTRILRFICKRMFSVRLHFGLRRQLQERVQDVIAARAVSVAQEGLGRHNVRLLLAQHLWLTDVYKIFRPAFRAEIVGVIWTATFDVLSAGFGDLGTRTLVDSLNNLGSRVFFRGRRKVQFFAVWNAGLHGGLRAAREKAREEEERIHHERESSLNRVFQQVPTDDPDAKIEALARYDEDIIPALNRRMFDLAWDAAGEGALREAQNVVNGTREMIGSRHREGVDRMWDAVWSIWNEVWEKTREDVRDRSIDTLKRVMRKILELGEDIVVEELSDARTHFLKGRILEKEQQMTNKTIQATMHDIMKKYTMNKQLKNVNGSMSRIWMEAQKLHGSSEPSTPTPDLEQISWS
ncbi:hypothetical protein Moror_15747 [Moniliophthora roreri MCA 2997]|uniref:Uncharacterized protein n=2 Tax=Moniliophthora roreri TaxID=221103 RepID=V2Y034_MONRO|nr:hypothetical protein Moror_15747 [Moniliophthora roreri MCA 2997]